MHVNPSVYLEMEDGYLEYIKFLEDFFAAEWMYDKFESKLLKSEDLFYGVYDIYWQLEAYPYFKPTLLSFSKISEDKIIAKVAFTYPAEDSFADVFAIYNFLIHKGDDDLKLSNIFKYQTQEWKSIEVEGNTYYSSPSRDFDLEQITRMNHFNKQIANYFEIQSLKFDYYVCKNMEEVYALRGYDYESSMFYNNGIGAITYPKYRKLLSGNNSEFYPHELVHLYTYKLFPNKNSKLDEGLSVYLGGSLNLKFEEFMPEFKDHIFKNETNLFAYVFEDIEKNLTIYKKPIEDLILAFLCYDVEKKYGKETLFSLMNSGRTDEELLLALEETLGLTKDNFNIYLRQQLKKYF